MAAFAEQSKEGIVSISLYFVFILACPRLVADTLQQQKCNYSSPEEISRLSEKRRFYSFACEKQQKWMKIQML